MPVEKLSSEDQFDRYAKFVAQVYESDPNFRPDDHLALMISNRSPFASHSLAQPFWFRDADRITAAATALVDERFNRHWNQRAGHVLHFEALPEADEDARLVLTGACDWLREKGCTFARAGFLYGWQIGFTVDSYDVPPTTFHTYSKPYYHRYLKNAGFATERGLVELGWAPGLRQVVKTLFAVR